MVLMPTSRTARVLLLVVACTGLVACGYLWHQARDSHARVVTESSGGWKTIEYDGVRVDVPASWKPLDTDDCEFQFEHWAPPDSPKCQYDGGVAFYASATFDPAHGPGVSRMGSGPTWGGYVYAGEYAVWASDDDRALVTKIVDSAR
jgi:hypothetical protein